MTRGYLSALAARLRPHLPTLATLRSYTVTASRHHDAERTVAVPASSTRGLCLEPQVQLHAADTAASSSPSKAQSRQVAHHSISPLTLQGVTVHCRARKNYGPPSATSAKPNSGAPSADGPSKEQLQQQVQALREQVRSSSLPAGKAQERGVGVPDQCALAAGRVSGGQQPTAWLRCPGMNAGCSAQRAGVEKALRDGCSMQERAFCCLAHTRRNFR